MVIQQVLCIFCTVGRCKFMLGNELSISIKLEHEVLQKYDLQQVQIIGGEK